VVQDGGGEDREWWQRGAECAGGHGGRRRSAVEGTRSRHWHRAPASWLTAQGAGRKGVLWLAFLATVYMGVAAFEKRSTALYSTAGDMSR
jgi:hypothetical protein